MTHNTVVIIFERINFLSNVQGEDVDLKETKKNASFRHSPWFN